MGKHVQSGCTHLYPSLAGSRSRGAGTSVKICARSQPGLERKRHGHIFSIGSSHQHDDGYTTGLSNSVGARQEEVASLFRRDQRRAASNVKVTVPATVSAASLLYSDGEPDAHLVGRSHHEGKTCTPSELFHRHRLL